MRTAAPSWSAARGRREGRGTLSPREGQVLAYLSRGLNGAAIAAELHLSPETVRTHVRNAMTKLGASTRSQAVALALQRGEIDADEAREEPRSRVPHDAPSTGEEGAGAGRARSGLELPPTLRAKGLRAGLDAVIAGLTSIYEVEGGAIYLVDDKGLTLRQVASSEPNGSSPFGSALTLGQGPIGTVASGRRAQVVPLPHPGSSLAAAVAPAYTEHRLVGLLCLTMRASRPLRRNELLLLQAFASRLAEIIDGQGEGVAARLAEALQRFRASWTASSR